MKTLGCLGFVAFAIVATLSIWFLEGYAITKFWGWFITPTFDVKTPGVWTCVGLAMMLGFLTNHQWFESFKQALLEEEDGKFMRHFLMFAAATARILMFLLSGWLVHCLGD